MLKIRLTRVGKKNSPSYRIVVAESKFAVQRKFIEIIGNYNPTLQPKTLVMNKERADFWMGRGAQPSDTVRNLMCDLGILDKKEKTGKVFAKKFTKKAIKEGTTDQPEVVAEAPAEEEAAVVAEEVAETPVVEEASEIAEEAPAEEAAEEVVTEEAPEVAADEVTTEEVAEVPVEEEKKA